MEAFRSEARRQGRMAVPVQREISVTDAEFPGSGYVTPLQAGISRNIGGSNHGKPSGGVGIRRVVGTSQGVRPGPRPAWGDLQMGEACVTPLKVYGVGKGPPHAGVSPSVHEAVRIAPMVVRPATDLTLSGMIGGETNQSRNCWNTAWIGRDNRAMESDAGDPERNGMSSSLCLNEPSGVERFPRRLGAREAVEVARTGAVQDRDREMHTRAVEGFRRRPSEVVYRRKDQDARDSGAVGRDRCSAGGAVEPVSVGEAEGGLDVELGDEWKEARAPDGKAYFYNRRTREARWTLPPSTVYVRDDSRSTPGYRIFCLRMPSEVKTASRASPASFLGRGGVGVAGGGGRFAMRNEDSLESKAGRERGYRPMTGVLFKPLSLAEPKDERTSPCRVEPNRRGGDVRGRVEDSNARAAELEVPRYAASRGTPGTTSSARSTGKSQGNPRRFLGGTSGTFEDEEEMKLSPVSVSGGSDTASSRADATVSAAAALLRRLVTEEGPTAAKHDDLLSSAGRCLRGTKPAKKNVWSIDRPVSPRASKDVDKVGACQESSPREGTGKATDCPMLPHRRVRAREGPYFMWGNVRANPVLEGGFGQPTRGDLGGQGRGTLPAGSSSSPSCTASQAPRWDVRSVSNGEGTRMSGMRAGDTSAVSDARGQTDSWTAGRQAAAGERDDVLQRARELISLVGRDGGTTSSLDDSHRPLGAGSAAGARNRGTNGMAEVGDDVVVIGSGGPGDVGGLTDSGVTRRQLERSAVTETVRSGSEDADPQKRVGGGPARETMCMDASKMASMAAPRSLSRISSTSSDNTSGAEEGELYPQTTERTAFLVRNNESWLVSRPECDVDAEVECNEAGVGVTETQAGVGNAFDAAGKVLHHSKDATASSDSLLHEGVASGAETGAECANFGAEVPRHSSPADVAAGDTVRGHVPPAKPIVSESGQGIEASSLSSVDSGILTESGEDAAVSSVPAVAHRGGESGASHAGQDGIAPEGDHSRLEARQAEALSQEGEVSRVGVGSGKDAAKSLPAAEGSSPTMPGSWCDATLTSDACGTGDRSLAKGAHSSGTLGRSVADVSCGTTGSSELPSLSLLPPPGQSPGEGFSAGPQGSCSATSSAELEEFLCRVGRPNLLSSEKVVPMERDERSHAGPALSALEGSSETKTWETAILTYDTLGNEVESGHGGSPPDLMAGVGHGGADSTDGDMGMVAPAVARRNTGDFGDCTVEAPGKEMDSPAQATSSTMEILPVEYGSVEGRPHRAVVEDSSDSRPQQLNPDILRSSTSKQGPPSLSGSQGLDLSSARTSRANIWRAAGEGSVDRDGLERTEVDMDAHLPRTQPLRPAAGSDSVDFPQPSPAGEPGASSTKLEREPLVAHTSGQLSATPIVLNTPSTELMGHRERSTPSASETVRLLASGRVTQGRDQDPERDFPREGAAECGLAVAVDEGMRARAEGSPLVNHRVRRQLFSEESEAKPLVFCPFCGEGVLKSGGLKHHLENCYVRQRCQGGSTHHEVIAAIRSLSASVTASGRSGVGRGRHVDSGGSSASRKASSLSSYAARRSPRGDNVTSPRVGQATGKTPPSRARGEEHPDDDRGKAAGGGEDPSASPKLERCEDCGRTFAQGRLQSHAKACRSVFMERRMPYDPKVMRAKGTPLEFFQGSSTAPSRANKERSAGAAAAGSAAGESGKKVPGLGLIGKEASRPERIPPGVPEGHLAVPGTPASHSGGAVGGKGRRVQGSPTADREPGVAAKSGSQCVFCGAEVPRGKLSQHLQTCDRKRRSTSERLSAGSTGSPKRHRSQRDPARRPPQAGRVQQAREAAPAKAKENNRVTCPHCGRGFSAASAPVHIGICARVENRPGVANRKRSPQQAAGARGQARSHGSRSAGAGREAGRGARGVSRTSVGRGAAVGGKTGQQTPFR